MCALVCLSFTRILKHNTSICCLKYGWIHSIASLNAIGSDANDKFIEDEHYTLTARVPRKTKDATQRIVDSNTAEKVAAAISNHISRSSLVLHRHPGPGLVLENLLKSGVTNHLLTETNQEYTHALKIIQERYAHDITDVVDDKGIQLFWFNKALSDSIYNKITPVSWDEDPCLSVIATLNRKKEQDFVRSLGNSLIHRDPLFQYGRPEFFIFVTRLEYLKLCFHFPPHNLKIYHSMSVMFYLLWDAKLICKVKKNRFSPPIRQRARSPSRVKLNFSDDHMYLVHLVPKVTPLTDLSETELHELVVFLKQMLATKHTRLIPKLESLVSNCGPRLIHLGFTMFTQIGDVTPLGYVHIFHNVRTWPEYQGSNLQHFTAESTSHYRYDDCSEAGIDSNSHGSVESTVQPHSHNLDKTEFIGQSEMSDHQLIFEDELEVKDESQLSLNTEADLECISQFEDCHMEKARKHVKFSKSEASCELQKENIDQSNVDDRLTGDLVGQSEVGELFINDIEMDSIKNIHLNSHFGNDCVTQSTKKGNNLKKYIFKTKLETDDSKSIKDIDFKIDKSRVRNLLNHNLKIQTLDPAMNTFDESESLNEPSWCTDYPKTQTPLISSNTNSLDRSETVAQSQNDVSDRADTGLDRQQCIETVEEERADVRPVNKSHLLKKMSRSTQPITDFFRYLIIDKLR